MANKWMKELAKLDGAVTERRNPHDTIIPSPSPSSGFIYGNSWGLPQGASEVLFGPPKAGKSLIISAKIGGLHRADKEAIAVKFNTELRETLQNWNEPANNAMFGVDPDRYMAIEDNTPGGVFDQIETKIGGMCAEGAPIKYVIIDSINSIQGRRGVNNTSINDVTIGDMAQTIQEGLKRILATQRKYKFAVTLTAQVRAEMDQLEIKRGNKLKMAGSFGLQHYAEYFIMVEQNANKEGRSNMLGEALVNENLKDMDDRAEQTGYKVRLTMKDSSLGPKGRRGEFTFDKKLGIINMHEEVFLLGTNRGVIERNGAMYSFGNKTVKGRENFIVELSKDTVLQAAILKELKTRDLAGNLGTVVANETLEGNNAGSEE